MVRLPALIIVLSWKVGRSLSHDRGFELPTGAQPAVLADVLLPKSTTSMISRALLALALRLRGVRDGDADVAPTSRPAGAPSSGTVTTRPTSVISFTSVVSSQMSTVGGDSPAGGIPCFRELGVMLVIRPLVTMGGTVDPRGIVMRGNAAPAGVGIGGSADPGGTAAPVDSIMEGTTVPEGTIKEGCTVLPGIIMADDTVLPDAVIRGGAFLVGTVV